MAKNEIRSIENLQNISGKTVLLRLDLNVPVGGRGEVMDDFRIRKAMPTLKYLRERGAKVRAVSHIGRGSASLRPVADYLVKESGFPLAFVADPFKPQAQSHFTRQKAGETILFENIRNYEGEESNDLEFAKKLSALADVYVNEAFAVSHREHASVVSVPKFLPSYAGFQLLEEIKHLRQALDPPHPFLFIIGGVKFRTKLPLIKKFLRIADHVFVGGALANNIFKEKGLEVGESLVSNEEFHLEEIVNHAKLILPRDVRVRSGAEVLVKNNKTIAKDDMILDSGPETIATLKGLIDKAKLVVWNGPLGDYEDDFEEGTEALAEAIAGSRARSIVGGGDTLAAIKKLNIERQFTFVSTGGGAMLDFLAYETLPGITALQG
jgi:3-phosphoglycerate kinase